MKLRLFRKKNKKGCHNCGFNNGIYDNCTVGTHYAETAGIIVICYEGEHWKPIKDKKS